MTDRGKPTALVPMTHTYQYPHPAVTTDVVLFTIREDSLQLLLIRRRNAPFEGRWALPGGFLDIDEDLERCAARELAEETGVTGIELEQLRTFGAVDRDPRERVISVVYFALARVENLHLRAGDDAADAGWFALRALPELAFDHDQIIRAAHDRLVTELSRSKIVFQFLPETFTLEELRRVYEILVDAEIDKRNFRRYFLTQGMLEPTGQLCRRGGQRQARLYRARERDPVAHLG
jgi:8-oxo-dGTP diphosphatase